MPGEFQYTSIEDALAILSRTIATKPRPELVGVRDAYKRVLAADVAAKEDSPRRDASHFDGFAIASADTRAATRQSPAAFTLRPGAARVGLLPKERLQRGQAMKVATGGYLPVGADAVLPMEDALLCGSKLKVVRKVERGEHVYPAGADVRKGERLLRAGRTLMGQDLVLLASLHVEKVAVFKKPTVTTIPTGSELTAEIGDRKSGRVVESHSLLLTHLVDEAGGRPVTFPIIPDEIGALSGALRDALKRSDVVLTLAGSSVGEPDLVESAIRGLGKSTSVLVHGIKVHRGRVMGFAVAGGKPVVILPGPIQGALNAFIVFGYPLIRHHLGLGFEQPSAVPATLGEAWEATGRFRGFDQVVYLRLTKDPKCPHALLAMPASGETEKVSFLTSKNAYALVSGKRPRLEKGDRIDAHLLPGFSDLQE